jgi:DNA sulfur modification protein DndC
MSNSEVLSKEKINEMISVVQSLFLADEIPWVIGYSGGKDSTATLQLVWYALLGLPVDKRKHKDIHVISTDTLVESPIVAEWVILSHNRMREAADKQDMPIKVHRLTPAIKKTFWVNLIGRGYPAPRPNFRWCTDRLKIEPSNTFIKDVIASYGEAILVLGTRKAESANRAKSMKHYEKQRVREYLSPNATMPNSLVFSPLEDWSNDNVWQYLLQYKNPWEHSNKDLLTMYRGASADGECPLVISTDTPSCGKSRFGCWVCTLVEQDKSMAAMILNDEEKAWMAPLLEFRNDIGNWELDRKRRDFRRMDGKLLVFNDRLVHGPYTKETRELWLQRLLEIQKHINDEGPDQFKDLKLITDAELREIRRIWLTEKHEFDDSLPNIFYKVTGEKYKYEDDFFAGAFGSEEWDLLKETCEDMYKDEKLLFQLQSSILDIERRSPMISLRKGVLASLEEQIRHSYYTDEDHAMDIKTSQKEFKESLKRNAQCSCDI